MLTSVGARRGTDWSWCNARRPSLTADGSDQTRKVPGLSAASTSSAAARSATSPRYQLSNVSVESKTYKFKVAHSFFVKFVLRGFDSVCLSPWMAA